ncbi:MAG: N-acetyltransferase [Rhodanobacteraceae bacterium]|nr:N-acetyltransferase [Rhodanobacteraceae bacterium]
MAAPATIDVRHEPEHSRFVASVDGLDSVVRYRIDGGVMHVLSTNVPPALEGRGIAAALNEAAIAHATARSLAIDPVCSYTAAYLRRRSSRALR